MRIYIARHGESLDDIEDCYGGIADFPLTDKGREQARNLAHQLGEAKLQIILSSPLVRARETADIIASELGGRIPVIVVENLKERNSYGVLSGCNKERAKQIFAHVLKGLKEKPGYSKEPLLGAEDFDEFVSRVHDAFNEVTDTALAQGIERLAVVTHGKFTQALFEYVLKIKGNVYLDLSALNIVDYEPAKAVLVRR